MRGIDLVRFLRFSAPDVAESMITSLSMQATFFDVLNRFFDVLSASWHSLARWNRADAARGRIAATDLLNPSVGCSSHPGRAAFSLWGTIEKNAALVGQRLCFVNNL